MSQRSEKLRRQVDILKDRMDFIDSRVYVMERCATSWDAADAAVHNQAAVDAEAECNAARRRARQAERNAATWRRIAYAALVVAIIVLIIAILAVSAVGVEITPAATPSAAEAPAVQTIASIQESFPEEPENELIEAALLAKAHVIEDCLITHYDVCVECCGKTDGITASGVQATPYVTVAVDPDVIPLGSDVLVDYGDGEIHYYRADDVGGAVKGNRIDLCVATHDEALRLGNRTATVYWVVPEEVP